MALKKIAGVKVEPLIADTYLSVLEASEGSGLFKTFYAKVNGKRMDITRGGGLSCAFFTTSILKLFNLVQEVQVTKNRALRDMRESGWVEIARPKRGCVVIWGARPANADRMRKDGDTYQPSVEHCGFYLGNQVALSTGGDRESLVPVRHPLAYRPVLHYLWHPLLDKDAAGPARKSPRHQPGIFWHPNA